MCKEAGTETLKILELGLGVQMWLSAEDRLLEESERITGLDCRGAESLQTQLTELTVTFTELAKATG